MANIGGEHTIVKVGTTSSTVALADGVVQSVSFGDIEQTPIDDFGLGSTSKTQRPSKLVDFGETKIEMFYNPAVTEHALLRASSMNGSTIYVDLIDEEENEASIVGFVKTFGFTGYEVGGTQKVNITVKNNTLTFTDAS